MPEDRIFIGFDGYQKAIDCGVDMVILTTPPGFRPIHYKAAIEANGPSEMPEKYAWDAAPPVLPDAGGSYEHAVAVPGVYKPY